MATGVIENTILDFVLNLLVVVVVNDDPRDIFVLWIEIISCLSHNMLKIHTVIAFGASLDFSGHIIRKTVVFNAKLRKFV